MHRPKPFPRKPKWAVDLWRARATNIAVPPTFDLGTFSPIKELGMSFWAADGPWVGGRLAAVSSDLESNGIPLPTGWDWAARSLELIAPDPLSRPLPGGLSDPMPTIAEAEKND